MSKPHVYAIVRRDLPIGDQFCQLGHACLCAASRFKDCDKSSIVCLIIRNKEKLINLADKLDREGIKYSLFYEPDINDYTAICTEPIHGEKRKIFKKFNLIT